MYIMNFTRLSPQVNSLLTSVYADTQRIPEDQPLACNCLNENGPSDVQSYLNPHALSFPHTCIRGYTVELNGILWAGLIPRGDSTPLYLPSVSCPAVPPDSEPITNALTRFILEARVNTTLDPVDVVTYEQGVHPGGGAPVRCFHSNITELVTYSPDGDFSLEFCTRGYCRGSLLSSWFVSDEDYPCISERGGVLCGQCRSGFAVTTYSTVSVLSSLLLSSTFSIASCPGRFLWGNSRNNSAISSAISSLPRPARIVAMSFQLFLSSSPSFLDWCLLLP